MQASSGVGGEVAAGAVFWVSFIISLAFLGDSGTLPDSVIEGDTYF
jgi:hypothetical protein